MVPLLAEISPDGRWILEALLADAPREAWPAWAGLSAFHLLRTRPPSEHPAYGTALLQWQRMVARFGAERAPKLAAEAFLGLARSARETAVPARLLELWVRHVPLPVEVAGRIVALDELPPAEAALVAEELALGAHEDGKPSKGILQLVLHRREPALGEARALAALELFTRSEVDADELAAALAPGLCGPGPVDLPEVTARLAGGMRNPVAFTPELAPKLAKVIARVRLEAVRASSHHPAANAARRIVACLPSLTAEEALALAEPDRAGEPAADVGLPDGRAISAAVAQLAEPHAVRVALMFPALSGAVERGRALSGLTAWRAARDPSVPLRLAHRARATVPRSSIAQWDALAGGALPQQQPPPPSWPERLTASLRFGEHLSRDELLGANLELSGILFQSPGGPGLLGADGTLRNAVRTWPAPEQLTVSHPVELFDAERIAWQARLGAAGARAPVNQLFRELYRASGRELSRKRFDRLRGAELRPVSLGLLARRGWFPTLSPLEIAPELELGPLRARLLAEPSPSGPVSAGVEFTRDGQPVPLADVPERLLSEAWRDVDEALALGMSQGSYVPSPARAELVRALGHVIGLHDLRVEADHVAFRIGDKPERITLHNARPADGELVPDAAARARAASVLPFDDDGGIAALLVGRILARARPEESEPAMHVAPDKEGS